MIYPAVRDENWATASYKISDEVVEENAAGFTIGYTAFYEHHRIQYKAFCQIEASGDTISFSMKGVALSSFRSNRIGLCVLHPIPECAGKKILIEQLDGSYYESAFPELISPHQPFKGIKRMCWGMEGGPQAELMFEGDVFETEDQRNWTDASYKTYSRPLELPYPFDVSEGDSIEQKVTLRVSGKDERSNDKDSPASESTEKKIPFPDIGYSRRKGSRHLSNIELTLLRSIRFQHYRVELRMEENDWKNELALALSEAKELDTKLELVIFFGAQITDDVKQLVDGLLHEYEYIQSILVLNATGTITPHDTFHTVRDTLKRNLPGVIVGYGTDGFFAQLNRNRPQNGEYDFVSFSINPQAHAVDTRTIIENLSDQADVLATAQSFLAGKAIHVSPITFTTRSNDGKDVDARLHTSFGAWWTLHTLRNLCAAKSITFYETVGGKGIIKDAELSDGLQSMDDLVTPLYKALAAIHVFAPVYLVIINDEDFIIENASGERLAFVLSQSRASLLSAMREV